jgi:hypothetical protein
MDMWDLKKWRRKLGYTQLEAAENLGVSRAAIQHWECERTPVPHAVDLACEEIERRWKRRPEFGPVVLVYADEPMWPEADCPSRVLCMQRELYPNCEAAIGRASRLIATPNFSNPLIIDPDGGVVWSTPELMHECEKRSQNAKGAVDYSTRQEP